MQPFTTLTATACPLGLENIDTDQIIAARFMSRSRAQGYGGYLLHDLRLDAEGASKSFVLDDPRYAGSAILVTRRNFGTGSSREAAVYALWDFGIRCVIAPSFGDIFAANAVKNGLLPAVLPDAAVEDILAALAVADKPELGVNLEAQTIRSGNIHHSFSIDPVRRQQLLNGWDELDLTLRHEKAIAAFGAKRRATHPWIVPAKHATGQN